MVNASSPLGIGTAFAPVGGTANPTAVLTYGGPVSNDTVSIGFKQPIGCERRASHGRLREDAHVHPVHDAAVNTPHSRRRHSRAPALFEAPRTSALSRSGVMNERTRWSSRNTRAMRQRLRRCAEFAARMSPSQIECVDGAGQDPGRGEALAEHIPLMRKL